MSRTVICRDCSEGKHGACNGEAILTWDDDSVSLGPCECAEAQHLQLGEIRPGGDAPEA